MPYLCESFMTIRSRRTGLCASRNAPAPSRQGDAGAAAPTGFTPGLPGSVIAQLCNYSGNYRAATARGNTGFPGSAAAKLGKMGDRK
jgi:hypothetical protein